MKKSEWLEADDPTAMLSWLGSPSLGWVESTDSEGASFRHYVTERKVRLLTCAVVRSLYPNGFGDPLGETNKRVKQAVLVAERFADGTMDHEWRGRAMNAADLIKGPEGELAFGCLRADAALGLEEAVRRHSLMDLFGDQSESRRIVAKLIRDFFGDPWDEVRLAWDQREVPCPDCPEGDPDSYCDDCSGSGIVRESVYPWLTPDVTMLAERAYVEVDPNLGTMDDLTLAALADALEEAGCVSEACNFCVDGDVGCMECEGAGHYYQPTYSLNRIKCPNCIDGLLPDKCRSCDGRGSNPSRLLKHLRRPKVCPICQNAGFYDGNFNRSDFNSRDPDFMKKILQGWENRKTPCPCNNLCGPIYRGDWAVDLLLWKK